MIIRFIMVIGMVIVGVTVMSIFTVPHVGSWVIPMLPMMVKMMSRLISGHEQTRQEPLGI